MTKEPPGLQKQKPTKTIPNTTDDTAVTCIKENPEIVTDCLRNERVMKTQRKQRRASVAGGLAIGTSADSAIGFADGGLLTGLGAYINKKVSTDLANRVTENNNTSPARIRYFGDPISAMGFDAKAVMPSFKNRWNNSAHNYSGLIIKDAVPIHEVEKNPLQLPPGDKDAEVTTDWLN